MIGVLVVAATMTVAISPAGLLLVQRLGRSIDRQLDKLLASLWIGLLLLATLLMTAALLMPLTPALGLVTAAGAGGAALLQPSVRKEIKTWLRQPRFWALWTVSVTFGGVLGIQPVIHYDTGLYHYQAIRWLAEYGTVRGLALIHERFGFASSYFALHAPLESGPLQERSPNILASFVLAVAVAHVIVGTSRLIRRTARSSDVLAAAGMLAAIGAARATELAASASPDHLALYMPVIAAWLMIMAAEHDASESPAYTDGLVWLLALLSFNVKPNLAPVAAVAFVWLLWRASQRMATAAWMTAVGAVAITPLLLTHLVLSGCLLFPAAFTCIDPSGVDPESARQTSDVVRDWARWNGPTPDDAASRSWILDWLTSRPAWTVVQLGAGVALLMTAVKTRISGQRGWVAPITLSILGIGFVFVTSPAFRFMAGYLALAIGLGASTLRSMLGRRWRSLDHLGASTAAVILTAILATALPGTTWLLPAELGSHSTTRTVQAPGWSHRVPIDDDRCWDAELPCIPYERGNVALRNSSIGDGFTR